jgi:hypothetical protein
MTPQTSLRQGGGSFSSSPAAAPLSPSSGGPMLRPGTYTSPSRASVMIRNEPQNYGPEIRIKSALKHSPLKLQQEREEDDEEGGADKEDEADTDDEAASANGAQRAGAASSASAGSLEYDLGGHSGSLETPKRSPGSGRSSTGRRSRGRISFADQHGGDLEYVRWCDDLHYSSISDHSESEGAQSAYVEKNSCAIM